MWYVCWLWLLGVNFNRNFLDITGDELYVLLVLYTILDATYMYATITIITFKTIITIITFIIIIITIVFTITIISFITIIIIITVCTSDKVAKRVDGLLDPVSEEYNVRLIRRLIQEELQQVPIYLPIYLPTYQPTYLPIYQVYLQLSSWMHQCCVLNWSDDDK